MRLVLLGPPGAGKGTQCKRICDKYKLIHLSSGDILRAERSANTELGQKAQGFMDSGALVPDDLIIAMMAGAISKAPATGYVLDGFPRTVVQGEALDKALAEMSEKIDAVVNFEVADDLILPRMTGRRSCPKCGGVYHVITLKPKVENQCDDGCGELVQRADDNAEVVANRLKIYHEQTAAVLGYYQGVGNTIINVDGAQAIDDVTKDAIAELEKLSS
jgi:adenylate kinase